MRKAASLFEFADCLVPSSHFRAGEEVLLESLDFHFSILIEADFCCI